jgi:hypothetical protein
MIPGSQSRGEDFQNAAVQAGLTRRLGGLLLGIANPACWKVVLDGPSAIRSDRGGQKSQLFRAHKLTVRRTSARQRECEGPAGSSDADQHLTDRHLRLGA